MIYTHDTPSHRGYLGFKFGQVLLFSLIIFLALYLSNLNGVFARYGGFFAFILIALVLYFFVLPRANRLNFSFKAKNRY